MEHIHKRFTSEQVKVLLKGYCQGTLDRAAIKEVLGISKTRFFALLRQYRQDSDKLTLAYQRSSPKRLSAWVEGEIEKELMLDKDLIDDSTLPLPVTTMQLSETAWLDEELRCLRLLSLPERKALVVISHIEERKHMTVRWLPLPLVP